MVVTDAQRNDIYKHIINDVLKMKDDDPLPQSLARSGFDSLHQMLGLSPDEIESLNYKSTDKDGKVIIDEVPPGIRKNITILQCYFGFKSEQGVSFPEQDWMNLTAEEFGEFRIGGDYFRLKRIPGHNMGSGAPTTQTFSGTVSTKMKDPVSEFRKGIKRDQSLFPKLRDDKNWHTWNLEFKAQIGAMDLDHIIDPLYQPSTVEDKELFREKQKFVYAAFTQIILTDQGKDYVRKYEHTSDAQRIYADLEKHASKSTKASVEATSLLAYVTAARIDDGRWKGTTNAFVLNWLNQIRKLENITDAKNHLAPGQKKTILENAVNSIPELANVKVQEDQHRALTGDELSFEQYLSLLNSATTAYDIRNQNKHNPKRNNNRQVYLHDIDTDVSTLDAPPDPDPFSNIYEAFAAQRRLKLNKDQWSRLSTDARTKWDELDDNAKNVILEQKITHHRNTQVNLHDISAFDYLQQLQDSNQNDTSETNTPSQITNDASTDNDTATTLLAQLHEQSRVFQAKEASVKDTKLPPGNISRVLSTKLAQKDPDNNDPKELVINGVTYRQVHMARVLYQASRHERTPKGALVDRGCNGGICGSDARVIYTDPHRTVNVQGIDNHQMCDIPIVTAGGVVPTQLGDIIIIMHQYAYSGNGKTIHSSGQLEMHGLNVNEKSRKVKGGSQRIQTPEGYIIPLNIRSGLPYMTMRPFTDDEWDSLPHVIVSSDANWDPSVLDSELDDTDDWYDAQTDIPVPTSLFDVDGNYKHPVLVHSAELCTSDLEDHLLPTLGLHYEVYERRTRPNAPDFAALRPHFGWSTGVDIIKKTFAATTQYARMPMSTLLTKHFKSPHPALNVKRRNEPVATDTIYSDTPAIDNGCTQAQYFVGTETLVMDAYDMKTDSQFVTTLEDNIRRRGAPDRLLSDSAQVETSTRAHDLLRAYVIDNWQSEPLQQHQNPAERHYQNAKRMTNNIMEKSGSPAYTWFLALCYVCFLLNHLAHARLDYRTPIERLTGVTPDISPLLRFHWWERVYYKVDDASFPSETREKRGRFVGIAENVGHALTFKILTDDTKKILCRSNVRSAEDPSSHNLRADFFSGEAEKDFIHSGRTNPSNSEDIGMMVIQPEDLVGRTYLTRPQEDGQRFRAKVVEAIEQHQSDTESDPQHIRFRCTVDDEQFEEIVSYNELLDYIERDQQTDGVWKFKRIVGHQGPLSKTHPKYKGSSYNVMLEWESGEITYEPLTTIAADDPVTCAIYARDKQLLDKPGWRRFKGIARKQKKMFRMANQAKLRSFRTAPKYQYGFEVPRDYAHACILDNRAGNNKWKNATTLEMDQLDEYHAFDDRGHIQTTAAPPGYKRIRVHLIYAVKHDGRHKARCVADGHLTDIPVDSVYSGVVSLRGLRTLVFLAELNQVQTWATDIGNAYLEAKTSEKVYIVAGPEFGDLRIDHILVIFKALYGLRTSGLRWHERLSVVLKSEGFQPCIAEPDIWMRENRERRIYEYIAVYVDDLAFAMVNPQAFVASLQDKHKFKLKSTGNIAFHLGCDFFRDDDNVLCMAPRKYIERMTDGYERMFGERPKLNTLSPLEKGDHPELDTTELLDEQGISKYQSLIGSMQWAVSLGRFDVATAVMTLSSFRSAPRVGHLERAKRAIGYLAKMKHAMIRFRTLRPDYSDLPDRVYEWEHSVYGDVKEALPHNAPTPLGKPVTLTHYVDANLYHDVLTGRSVTGILHLYNQCPIDWFSKKQATTETATYGSEYVASRTCVEQIIDARNTLRYLGVPIYEKSYMFGDNESVVNSSMRIDSKLHKRHTALSYHRVRESIAAKIVSFFHIPGPSNPADVLSKHWGYSQVWQLLQPLLFWKGDTADIPRKDIESS